jgi:aspartate/glutamate racemase
MGPESTIAYYRAIIAAARDRRLTSPPVPVLTNSIDIQKVLRLVGENALAALTDYLVAEIDVLAKGGATLC